MSEDPDYMSDEFLQSCINSAGVDCPGLIKSRKEQREHDLMKIKNSSGKGNEATTNNKCDEAAKKALEEAMKTPIPSDNKGFLMIQKMGFKPGTGLGKKCTGITDPVAVSLKNDRRGLGNETKRQIQEKLKKLEEEKREKLTNVEDYVAIISRKHKEREMESDLRRSQRICHQLDLQSSIEEPIEQWFWPLEVAERGVDENRGNDGSGGSKNLDKDEVEIDVSDKLEILTYYLRNTYCYCIWCGIQYADEKDLQDCPGPQRDLH